MSHFLPSWVAVEAQNSSLPGELDMQYVNSEGNFPPRRHVFVRANAFLDDTADRVPQTARFLGVIRSRLSIDQTPIRPDNRYGISESPDQGKVDGTDTYRKKQALAKAPPRGK